MKKLVIAAAVMALSTGVNAQEKAGGTGTAGIGGLSVATLTAMGISAAVAAAIISNNRGSTINPGQEFELVCRNELDTLANGVCTNTTSTVTVTGTGTNTSTTTVPVITTYPAIVQPVN
ncbi:hypothetical protein [Rheinheimera fenheensis]|uniref:hypothetical protein n=1 Tax=Rheinheimera fenheensis TaxID=3152295 RepID=UPI00325DB386